MRKKKHTVEETILELTVGFKLINFPATGSIPDYDAVVSTITLIEMYNTNKEAIPKKYHSLLDTWLQNNDLNKFYRLRDEAEDEQDKMYDLMGQGDLTKLASLLRGH